MRKRTREHEAAKEAEVKAALETAEMSWSENGTVPFHSLDGKFRLYLVTHLDHCYDPNYYPFKYVEFYYFDEENRVDLSGLRARDEKSQLNGHMYLNGSIDCHFTSFLPPLEASPEPFEINSLKGDREHTLAFRIIDNDHFKLKVGRNLVLMDQPRKAKGPETFVFMGIRDDYARQRLLEMRQRSTIRTRVIPLLGSVSSINAGLASQWAMAKSEGPMAKGSSQARRRRKRKARRDRQ